MAEFIVIAWLAWRITQSIHQGRVDQEYARKGIVSPRLVAKYGNDAGRRTGRWGLWDFVLDAARDAWQDRHEAKKVAREAKAAGEDPWEAVKRVLGPDHTQPKPPAQPTPASDQNVPKPAAVQGGRPIPCPHCGQPLTYPNMTHPDGSTACPTTSGQAPAGPDESTAPGTTPATATTRNPAPQQVRPRRCWWCPAPATVTVPGAGTDGPHLCQDCRTTRLCRVCGHGRAAGLITHIGREVPACAGCARSEGYTTVAQPLPEPATGQQQNTNVIPFPFPKIKEGAMSTDTTTTGEVLGLDQAIAYAANLNQFAGDHGMAGNEGYIGYLTARKVSGEALASARAMQEAFSNAADAAKTHADELAKQKTLQEAYDANPDAGDKDFQQEGR